MENDALHATLKKIKKTHENFTIGIGISIGIILFGYFFSFAGLIDHLKSGIVAFQFITTILFILCLIFLKKVAFFCTKLKYSKNSSYRPILEKLVSADFDKKEQEFLQAIETRFADK